MSGMSTGVRSTIAGASYSASLLDTIYPPPDWVPMSGRSTGVRSTIAGASYSASGRNTADERVRRGRRDERQVDRRALDDRRRLVLVLGPEHGRRDAFDGAAATSGKSTGVRSTIAGASYSSSGRNTAGSGHSTRPRR